MYQLVSAVARSRVAGSRWVELDIGDIQLVSLYSEYEQIHATLTNNFIQGQLGLNLEDIKTKYNASTMTFNEMLIANGNTTLPVNNKTYTIETRVAKYGDAVRLGFKIQPVKLGGHPDADLPISEKTCLSVTRDGSDYRNIFENTLISVNGFIHRTDTNGERLYVIDGMKTRDVSNSNQLGITSFVTIGKLSFIPITESMIHQRNPGMSYRENMYIDCGVDTSNKMVLLVLGGYLHILDKKTFTRVSDSIFSINFRNFPLRDRYFESVDRIDLTSLALDHSTQNSYQISDEQLFSDAVLTKYATLSQSFFVIVDAEDLFVEKVEVEHTKSPFHYISYSDPLYPLVGGVGKLIDYWKREEDLQWSLTVNEPVRGNYVYNTTPEGTLQSIDNSREPGDPIFFGRAHLLKIGTDLRVQTGV